MLVGIVRCGACGKFMDHERRSYVCRRCRVETYAVDVESAVYRRVREEAAKIDDSEIVKALVGDAEACGFELPEPLVRSVVAKVKRLEPPRSAEASEAFRGLLKVLVNDLVVEPDGRNVRLTVLVAR